MVGKVVTVSVELSSVAEITVAVVLVARLWCGAPLVRTPEEGRPRQHQVGAGVVGACTRRVPASSAEREASQAPRGTEGGPIALGEAPASENGVTGSPSKVRTPKTTVSCNARETRCTI